MFSIFGKNKARETDFWNFEDEKKYVSESQKLGDFFFGLFIPMAVFYLGFFYLSSIFLVILLLFLITPMYLWNRRQWIALGMTMCGVCVLVIAYFLLPFAL